MPSCSTELNHLLLDLAWSLWTEVGVAGVKRKHQKVLISLEELIILTTALAEIDPRLRDESLDWLSSYHHFISITRLKSIIKSFGDFLLKPFSIYSATLNSLATTNWPLFQDASPLKVTLSNKSHLPALESPALLNIRARSLFGTGARADLLTFFATHPQSDYSASDVTEIGYSKRNLAEILEELCLSGLFEKFLLRNQWRYRLKGDQLIKMLGSIPDYAPSWRTIFEVLLPLRDCIHRTEKSSQSTQVVEIRNLLMRLQKQLNQLKLTPPSWQNDVHAYLNSYNHWLLKIVRNLSQGDPL